MISVRHQSWAQKKIFIDENSFENVCISGLYMLLGEVADLVK